MKEPTTSTHPFGELITRYRQRRPGLTQRGLAELAGYDAALLARMCQGKRDLTGPSGRERVLRLIETLSGLRLLTSLQQANELLLAAQMPPLFEKQPAEAKLIALLAPSIGARRIRRTNLPAALTSFVGRTVELAHVRELLSQGRLVTLIGAGGSGKTRLAQRTGADVLIDYEDGVWYVELGSQSSGLYLAEVFMRAVGAPPAESAAIEALIEYLADKRLLLVVDNCEHIVEHVAELVETLLSSCAGLKVLATSRESLNVEGELAWAVPPLAEVEACQLFGERAASARLSRLPETNDKLIQRICMRLDFMPLAIELAAACTNALDLTAIEARLDDRFELLARGRRGAVARHQTLRAMLEWSHELLTTEERVLLRRLSVFNGGWTLEHAVSVTSFSVLSDSSVPTLLTSLVNKSLVAVDEAKEGLRYRYLETIREFAQEKAGLIGEADQLALRHAEAFGRFAQSMFSLIQNDLQAGLDAIRRDYANIVTAIHWCFGRGQRPDLGCELVLGTVNFWDCVTTFMAEGRRLFRQAYAAISSDLPVRSQAWLHFLYPFFIKPAPSNGYYQEVLVVDDYVNARRQAYDLFKLTDDQYGRTISCGHMANILCMLDPESAEGKRLTDECLRYALSTGSDLFVCMALQQRAQIFMIYSDWHRVAQELSESCLLARRVRDENMLLQGLVMQAAAYLALDREDDAYAALSEAQALCMSLSDPMREAIILGMQSDMARTGRHTDLPLALSLASECYLIAEKHAGAMICADFAASVMIKALAVNQHFDRAWDILKKRLRVLYAEVGLQAGYYAELFDAAALLTSIQGRTELAGQLFGVADAATAARHGRRAHLHAAEQNRFTADIKHTLGVEAYSRLYDQGATTSLEATVAMLVRA